MNSLAYQIAAAIQTLLTVPAMASLPSSQVRIEPVHPADVEQGAALNVELGNENPAERLTIGRKDRTVELKLTAIAAGAAAVATTDAIITEAHQRLMQDVSLGGLAFDIDESGTTRANDSSGTRKALIEKTYLINYQTSETSLES